MIVWVASYPRSGNRLSRAVLRETFGVKWIGSAAAEETLRRDLGPLLAQLGVGADDDPLPALREFEEPVYLKTHSLPTAIHTLPEVKEHQPEEEEQSPALYIVRDGRDAIVSFAHYSRDNNPRLASMSYEEAVWDLVRRKTPFGGWSGNVRAWRERTGPTAVVRFEDLIRDPVAAIATGCAELGLELPAQTGEPPSFDQMKSKSPRPELLRKGWAGGWTSEFPRDLLPKFWHRHGEQMEALGYPRRMSDSIVNTRTTEYTPIDPERIRNSRPFNQPWYYSIELAPGLYTAGQDPRPVAQTRELLRHVDVESGGADGGGARCLDLGIQEGLVTTLLERRGGAEVVGYDRVLRKARLRLVERALGTSFDLVGGMKLQDLPRSLAKQGRDPFDVVVFSGVLYHMFDPLGGLAVARGFVREGGIMLVETTVAFEDSDSLLFNRAGRFTPFGVWFFTPRLLDYLLRFLRLKALDVVHLNVRGEEQGKPAQGRIAVACRAVPEPLGEPGDQWIVGSKNLDFAEFLDWDAVASDAPEVGYDASRAGVITREDGSADLQATVAGNDELATDADQIRLALGAKY